MLACLRRPTMAHGLAVQWCAGKSGRRTTGGGRRRPPRTPSSSTRRPPNDTDAMAAIISIQLHTKSNINPIIIVLQLCIGIDISAQGGHLGWSCSSSTTMRQAMSKSVRQILRYLTSVLFTQLPVSSTKPISLSNLTPALYLPSMSQIWLLFLRTFRYDCTFLLLYMLLSRVTNKLWLLASFDTAALLPPIYLYSQYRCFWKLSVSDNDYFGIDLRFADFMGKAGDGSKVLLALLFSSPDAIYIEEVNEACGRILLRYTLAFSYRTLYCATRQSAKICSRSSWVRYFECNSTMHDELHLSRDWLVYWIWLLALSVIDYLIPSFWQTCCVVVIDEECKNTCLRDPAFIIYWLSIAQMGSSLAVY